jgi:drug/metabolite transporter (DMT)-like permease
MPIVTSRGKCLFFLAATAVLWSTAGVIIKTVAWNPAAIVSFRSLWAGLTLVLLLRFRGILDLSWPDRTQWGGALALALLSFCFVGATRLTTAANAILMQYTAPVWVALLAPLVLREKTSRRDWLFIGLTFGGLALFFLDSLTLQGLQGMGLGALSGVFFAGLVLFMRRGRGAPPMKILIYGNFLALLGGLYYWGPPWPSAGDMGLVALAGVFQFGLSYYLYSLASQGVSSLEMVLVTAIEPILNPVWVFLILGEKPGGWALAGGAVVLVTVTGWSVLKSRAKQGGRPA